MDIRKTEKKYLGSFVTLFWNRTAKIKQTDNVSNEDDQRRMDIEISLTTICYMEANWIGHILRRNCLLKFGINGMLMGTSGLKENESS